MPPAEPTPADLRNPLRRYVLASRPPFLSVTLFACLIGHGMLLAGALFSYG
jgi:hypothetical protein